MKDKMMPAEYFKRRINSDELLDTSVSPSSAFITTEFVNRVTPQFTTARDFVIHSSSPFHSARVWIRSLTNDYLLVEEHFPNGTCEFNVKFDGFFSTFNSNSVIEFLIFDKCDRKVRATLCYRDYHFCIIPHRGTKRKALMTTGPWCRNVKLSEQSIYVDGYDLVVEGENDLC